MTGRPDLGLLVVPSHNAREAVALATLAEASGFSYVWVADERFFRDPFQLLALIARATSSIRLGPCVVDPYTRLPVQIAVALATLDEISGGRAALGIGAGASGFRQLAIRRDPPPASAVAAAVRSIRQYLTDVPRPQERPGLDFTPARASVPIFIAAEGPQMLRVAGELGDGAILQAKVVPSLLKPARRAVLRAAANHRRGLPAIVARVDVSVADRAGTARGALKPRVARRLIATAPDFGVFREANLEVPPGLTRAVADVGYTNDPQVLAELGRDIPDEWVEHFCIAASRGDLAQRLDRLAEQGVDQILVHPVPAPGDTAAATIEAVGRWSDHV